MHTHTQSRGVNVDSYFSLHLIRQLGRVLDAVAHM